MAIGRKTGGRTPGTPNALGHNAKLAIAEAASQLGGPKRLVEWVQLSPENERDFWTKIYPRIVPHTITGDKDNPLHTCMKVTFE